MLQGRELQERHTAPPGPPHPLPEPQACDSRTINPLNTQSNTVPLLTHRAVCGKQTQLGKAL